MWRRLLVVVNRCDAIFHVFSMTQRIKFREKNYHIIVRTEAFCIMPKPMTRSYVREIMQIAATLVRARKTIIDGIFYITFTRITDEMRPKEFHCKALCGRFN